VADEFPTLEVVLAACVVGLGWRGVSLIRATQGLNRATEAWASAIQAGTHARISALEHDPSAGWITPLGRAALDRSSALPTTDGIREDPVIHRGARFARSLRSAAARDLVVCSVLAGALVYAWMTQLGVSRLFFSLGLLSTGLLLGSVLLRVRLARGLEQAAMRLSTAAKKAGRAGGRSAREQPRCTGCGFEGIAVISADDLGLTLRSLGVEEVRVCGECGRVGGHARGKATTGVVRAEA
jgi:hypothetical protein